jgi:hypothetical protein
MQKWEYMSLITRPEGFSVVNSKEITLIRELAMEENLGVAVNQELDKLGLEGWEAYSIGENIIFLKRAISK